MLSPGHVLDGGDAQGQPEVIRTGEPWLTRGTACVSASGPATSSAWLPSPTSLLLPVPVI